MKNIIIGTAGHIDHGKTTLIKALTGRDTDRLEEEKRRGITIDLGFTYFDLPNEKRAGIIDVPGHEKFIKNMLAGVIGMDIVLLVIAADEGIMPQTKEHLNILNLLGITKGIIVLTKCDLVDNEWITLVEEDIKDSLKGTFFEETPIIRVSSVNGKGLQDLTNTISKLTEELEERNTETISRLPIDRVFTISGHGTVITGTLITGKIRKGDEVEIYPIEKKCKIRNIQVHGKNCEIVSAGQRSAINLAGIKKSELFRGCVIAPKNSMKNTMMLDVKLELLEDSKRIIENRSRLHLYTGTSEVLCRVVLIDKDQLTPGESCYAQLRLEEQIAVRRGDKFIVRFYSPLETIGGGIILESNPIKKRRFDDNDIDELSIKEKGSENDVTEKIIKKMSKEIPSINEIAKITAVSLDEIKKHVDVLEQKGVISIFKLKTGTYLWHKNYEIEMENNIINYLESYHKQYPLRKGILKAEIKSKYFKNIKLQLFDAITENMSQKNKIKKYNEYLALTDFKIQYNKTHIEIEKEILKVCTNNLYNLMKINELSQLITSDDKNMINEIIYLMIDEKKLVKLNEDYCITKELLEEAQKILINTMEIEGSITAAKYRDVLNTNRKNTITLLEYFDKIKLTKRRENERVLYT